MPLEALREVYADRRSRLGLVIADASVVVAALNPMDGTNAWAVRALRAPRLFAPRVLPFEVATSLRRLERNKLVGRLEATAAHRELLELARRAGSGRIDETRTTLTRSSGVRRRYA